MDTDLEHNCYECEHFNVCDDGDGRWDTWCELGIAGCWEEPQVYLKGCDKWTSKDDSMELVRDLVI